MLVAWMGTVVLCTLMLLMMHHGGGSKFEVPVCGHLVPCMHRC